MILAGGVKVAPAAAGTNADPARLEVAAASDRGKVLAVESAVIDWPNAVSFFTGGGTS